MPVAKISVRCIQVLERILRTADTSKSGSTLLSMASGGSKGLASSQGGNEATGALQTGGSVEHTKLNSAGTAVQTSRRRIARARVNACKTSSKVKIIRTLMLLMPFTVTSNTCEISVCLHAVCHRMSSIFNCESETLLLT